MLKKNGRSCAPSQQGDCFAGVYLSGSPNAIVADMLFELIDGKHVGPIIYKH